MEFSIAAVWWAAYAEALIVGGSVTGGRDDRRLSERWYKGGGTYARPASTRGHAGGRFLEAEGIAGETVPRATTAIA